MVTYNLLQPYCQRLLPFCFLCHLHLQHSHYQQPQYQIESGFDAISLNYLHFLIGLDFITRKSNIVRFQNKQFEFRLSCIIFILMQSSIKLAMKSLSQNNVKLYNPQLLY